MYRVTFVAVAAVVLMLAPATEAGDAKGNGKYKSRYIEAQQVGAGYCPPGLAKKNPPCVPPGQAKKWGYRVGDRIDWDRYPRIDDPGRYGWPRGTYVVLDGRVVRIDEDTRAILTILGAVDDLLN